MKRIYSLLIAVLVLLSLTVPARAEVNQSLAEDLVKGVRENETVDVSGYYLSTWTFSRAFDEIYYSGLLPWYAEGSYSYSYNETGMVQSVTVEQLDENQYDRGLYERYLAELINEACLPGMSDWQKVLSVHDYIVLHTVYDESLALKTGYDALVNGSTVCSGYTALFMDVMNRLGIPCQSVVAEDTGDGEGHSWNVVQLDGQWYHVDLTWDDPTRDTYGYSNHVYFLKTDGEFWLGQEDYEAHDFYWECYVDVAEEPYSADDFLADVNSPVCFVDTEHVIFRRNGDYSNSVVSRDLTTGEETTLYSFDKKAMDLGEGQYLYPTCGLNFWNGRVYFNREHEILSMLPDGSDVQVVYTYESDTQYVYGAMVDDGVLYMTLCDWQFEKTPMEVALDGMEYHSHTYAQRIEPSTCQQEGCLEWICECGVFYIEKMLPLAQHQLIETVEQKATLFREGVTWYHCGDCEYEYYEFPSVLPNLNIDFSSGPWSGIGRAALVIGVVFILRVIRILLRSLFRKR